MARAPILGLVSLLLLLVCAPSPAGAQAAPGPTLAPRPGADPPRPRFTFWLGGGYGRGRASQFSDVEEAFTLNASAQRGPLLMSLRAAVVSSSIFDMSSDAGLLVGVASSPLHRFHVGGAVGLGVASGNVDGGLLTVPTELQLSWRFSRYTGLGLYAFASLNRADTFGGASLAVQLGRLR